MEIEIGEYVKTKTGLIGKVKKIVENSFEKKVRKYIILDDENKTIINYTDVVKHSYNREELED